MNKLVSMDEIMPVMREKIENGGKVCFTPKGNSMLPLLRNGIDTVTLEKTKVPLKKYSIVFYQRGNGQYVLHRLIGRKEQCFVMRGDNQFRNETGIKEEQIIAVVTEFCRDGKVYDIDDRKYRFYSFFWTNTIYIRFVYKLSRHIAGKIKRKILRKR